MQKFFISSDEFNNKTITGDSAYQLKNVLRARVNDEFLVGVNCQSYLVKISNIDAKEIKFEIIGEETGDFELPVFVSLFQGYPKGDKFENIIKYGTQLGISEINPVIMNRTIVKIDDSKKDNKLLRFGKIAKEAAEQSFRNVVPTIGKIEKIKNIDFSNYDIKIVCYEEDAKNNECSAFKKAIKNAKINDKIAIVVGPEGGITNEEIDYLKSQGFITCALGPRILRTETVVFYCLSAISYEWELK